MFYNIIQAKKMKKVSHFLEIKNQDSNNNNNKILHKKDQIDGIRLLHDMTEILTKNDQFESDDFIQ